MRGVSLLLRRNGVVVLELQEHWPIDDPGDGVTMSWHDPCDTVAWDGSGNTCCTGRGFTSAADECGGPIGGEATPNSLALKFGITKPNVPPPFTWL